MEKQEELVDMDEKGNVINEENKKDKKTLSSFCKILLFIILIIIIFCIIYVFRTFKRMNQIELIIANNYDEMSLRAADIFTDLIKKNPHANLGLATGSTPLGLYKELIKRNKNKEISFKNITTYNLDEYCGIPQNHEQSYFSFMKENLFNYIDINLNNTHIPKAEGDIKLNAENYEKMLEENKLNIQLLGVGRNGHIGFNEPGSDFHLGVHDVQLDEKTIQDNARFFGNDMNKVPKNAITMGIKNILDAEIIVLMANGTKKAEAIESVMSGVVDKNIPVSALNTHKGKVYVIVDKEAASKL
jgi:glucosamine-6-phosphate deaminase